MEILNFGGLPYGMELDTIIKNHISNPRNAGMASVFKRSHYIEKYGRGFEKMISSYADTGVEGPEFDASDVFFCVKFKNIVYAKGIVPRDFNGNEISVTDEVHSSLKLTDNQCRILSLLRENSKLTASTIAELMDISERTVRYDLSEMVDLGIVYRKGSRKSGEWIILKRTD